MPEDERETIADAAADISDMIDEATRWGWELAIEIAGRTDTTGAEEVNQTLSTARAERVRRGLVRQGLDPTILTIVGLGNESPMSVSGYEDLQRLNRSVTFVVTTMPTVVDEDAR